MRRYLGWTAAVALATTIAIGVVTGLATDLPRTVLDWATARLRPEDAMACVTRATPLPPQPDTALFRVAVTYLPNDRDEEFSRLAVETLRGLYSELPGAAIDVVTVPCILREEAGSEAEIARRAESVAEALARRAHADVVIWGEVGGDRDSLDLRLSHETGTDTGEFRVARFALPVALGEALGPPLAARTAALVRLSEEEAGQYTAPIFELLRPQTAQLATNPPPGLTEAQRAVLVEAHAYVLFFLGRQRAEPETLRAAAASFIIAIAGYDRAGERLAWASAQNSLGAALLTLGVREASPAGLQSAIAAFEAALTERHSDTEPLEWAQTQLNLGIALRSLGQRESGTARLRAAIAAFEAALTGFTRDATPITWANTQMALGNALATLGEREGSAARLEAAIAAYDSALLELTRDRVPFSWAALQMNRGTALSVLARLEPRTARLESAVAAHRAALTVFTRDKAPNDWAMTQSNLGNALAEIAAREPGAARIPEARAAQEAALTVWTREAAPLQWAMTQGNLANLALIAFDKTADPAHLDEAEAQARAAREVFVKAQAAHMVTMADRLLADIATRRGG
ncbi:hypothetical protein [Ostreiculturibacter nitratireducens]|uniref:hypothetical protein n=1 Tax=Ostreiculturibacter nitratireducens TaxID=3075226 RepID=UPI0031B569D1